MACPAGNSQSGTDPKSLPKRSCRTLFAAAEERPANATLVVLRSPQGQRRHDDVVLVSEGPGPPGQFRGPVRIALQLALRHPVGGAPIPKVLQG